jgi:hypothetical protein
VKTSYLSQALFYLILSWATVSLLVGCSNVKKDTVPLEPIHAPVVTIERAAPSFSCKSEDAEDINAASEQMYLDCLDDVLSKSQDVLNENTSVCLRVVSKIQKLIKLKYPACFEQ